MFTSAFSFHGRIGRTEYGLSVIIHIFTYCFIALILAGNSNLGIFGFGFIPLLWFIWAQGAKRCHDLGHSGWMQFVPFYILWMIFQEGSAYANQYGENPKQIEVTPIVESRTLSFPESQITILEAENVNYCLVQDIMKNLRRLEQVKNQSYTLLDHSARITINHRNTSQAILDGLYATMENIEVVSVGSGFINIKIK